MQDKTYLLAVIDFFPGVSDFRKLEHRPPDTIRSSVFLLPLKNYCGLLDQNLLSNLISQTEVHDEKGS